MAHQNSSNISKKDLEMERGETPKRSEQITPQNDRGNASNDNSVYESPMAMNSDLLAKAFGGLKVDDQTPTSSKMVRGQGRPIANDGPSRSLLVSGSAISTSTSTPADILKVSEFQVQRVAAHFLSQAANSLVKQNIPKPEPEPEPLPIHIRKEDLNLESLKRKYPLFSSNDIIMKKILKVQTIVFELNLRSKGKRKLYDWLAEEEDILWFGHKELEIVYHRKDGPLLDGLAISDPLSHRGASAQEKRSKKVNKEREEQELQEQ